MDREWCRARAGHGARVQWRLRDRGARLDQSRPGGAGIGHRRLSANRRGPGGRDRRASGRPRRWACVRHESGRGAGPERRLCGPYRGKRLRSPRASDGGPRDRPGPLGSDRRRRSISGRLCNRPKAQRLAFHVRRTIGAQRMAPRCVGSLVPAHGLRVGSTSSGRPRGVVHPRLSQCAPDRRHPLERHLRMDRRLSSPGRIARWVGCGGRHRRVQRRRPPVCIRSREGAELFDPLRFA